MPAIVPEGWWCVVVEGGWCFGQRNAVQICETVVRFVRQSLDSDLIRCIMYIVVCSLFCAIYLNDTIQLNRNCFDLNFAIRFNTTKKKKNITFKRITVTISSNISSHNSFPLCRGRPGPARLEREESARVPEADDQRVRVDIQQWVWTQSV